MSGIAGSKLLRWALLLAAAVLGLYALLLALLWWRQESLLFLPQPLPADHAFHLPADVHEVFVDVPGARLNALHLRLPRPDGVVFYLHGNAGNLEGWFSNPDFYRAMNVDLFMVDYRGYGKSTGHISSQAQLIADMQVAWQAVAPQYAGRPVVFLGRSLGTGIAAQMVAAMPVAQRPALLLLVSPFISLQALAAQYYAWVPAWLLRYPMRTDLALQALGTGNRPQVVLLHGEQDALIPVQHSEALAAGLPGAVLRRIPRAGHNDLQDYPDYLQAVRDAVQGATKTAMQ